MWLSVVHAVKERYICLCKIYFYFFILAEQYRWCIINSVILVYSSWFGFPLCNMLQSEEWEIQNQNYNFGMFCPAKNKRTSNIQIQFPFSSMESCTYCKCIPYFPDLKLLHKQMFCFMKDYVMKIDLKCTSEK